MKHTPGPLQDFDQWWEADGKFYDPDWDDVAWFYKRESLAEYAYNRAWQAAYRAGQIAQGASHDDLLEALKLALAVINNPQAIEPRAAERQIRAVLAKIQEGARE